MSGIDTAGSRRRTGLILLCGLLLTVSAALAQPPAAPGGTVDMAFGTGIDRETRALVGKSTAFDAQTEQIYCFTRVKGLVPPAAVTHAWYLNGKTMARVELNIGSGNWRTWSAKRIRADWTGDWEVKVLDATGQVLASESFTVQ